MKDLDQKILDAVIAAQKAFGAPEKMWVPDSDTGEYVFVDMDNPSPEALALLKKITNKETV